MKIYLSNHPDWYTLYDLHTSKGRNVRLDGYEQRMCDAFLGRAYAKNLILTSVWQYVNARFFANDVLTRINKGFGVQMDKHLHP